MLLAVYRQSVDRFNAKLIIRQIALPPSESWDRQKLFFRFVIPLEFTTFRAEVHKGLRKLIDICEK